MDDYRFGKGGVTAICSFASLCMIPIITTFPSIFLARLDSEPLGNEHDDLFSSPRWR